MQVKIWRICCEKIRAYLIINTFEVFSSEFAILDNRILNSADFAVTCL